MMAAAALRLSRLARPVAPSPDCWPRRTGGRSPRPRPPPAVTGSAPSPSAASRDLASAGLQFLATAGNAPVTWWHEPAVGLSLTVASLVTSTGRHPRDGYGQPDRPDHEAPVRPRFPDLHDHRPHPHRPGIPAERRKWRSVQVQARSPGVRRKYGRSGMRAKHAAQADPSCDRVRPGGPAACPKVACHSCART